MVLKFDMKIQIFFFPDAGQHLASLKIGLARSVKLFQERLRKLSPIIAHIRVENGALPEAGSQYCKKFHSVSGRL